MVVDAIVPCYDEEQRIGRVLSVLSSSPYINKVIVVDDGSNDNSAEVAKSFPKVTLVKLKKNVGKGGAVRRGLMEATTPAVFLCDADLKGFREEHVAKFVKAYEENTDGLIVGFRNNNDSKLLLWIRKHLLQIEGERLLSTEDLRKVTSSQTADNFGLDPWMNYCFRKNRKKKSVVVLDGVSNDILFFKRKDGPKRLLDEYYVTAKTYAKINKDALASFIR